MTVSTKKNDPPKESSSILSKEKEVHIRSETSKQSSVNSRRKEEPRVEPATSPPKKPTISSTYYVKNLPSYAAKHNMKGNSFRHSMTHNSLLNSSAIQFKKHKMELVAHLHHTTSVLKNVFENPEYHDYELIKPKMTSDSP